MIGDGDVTRNVFLASKRFWKNGGQQIVGTHALDLRRNFFPTAKAKQGQRAPSIPAPARGEEWRSQHGLLQNGADGIGMEKMEDGGEREAMLFAERDIQAVVGGRSLQLEIEGTAEALAQGEAPSFVDARAERSRDHELHAAAFVEEALGEDGRLRGNCSQRRAAGHDV